MWGGAATLVYTSYCVRGLREFPVCLAKESSRSGLYNEICSSLAVWQSREAREMATNCM